MGFLKKLGKKIKKGARKIGKKVKKYFKKINFKKVLKIVAIAGAAIVTGGAAIGAFGGSLATSTFGSWMIGASNTILGLPVVGTLAKPFAFAGKAIGSTIGAGTDLLGITERQSRLGYMFDNTTGKYVVDTSKTFAGGGEAFKGKTLAEVKGGTDTFIGLGKTVTAAGDVAKLELGQIYDSTTNAFRNMNADELKAAGYDPTKFMVNAKGQIVSQTTGEIVKGAAGSTMTGSVVGDVLTTSAISTGMSLAGGVIQQNLMEDQSQGQPGVGLGEERGIQLSPLEIAYAQSGFDFKDIYETPYYGNADPVSLGASLYNQETIEVV